MGRNFKENQSEDAYGFRSSIKSANSKNEMKQRKSLEKKAKKMGVSIQEYLQLTKNENF